MGTWYGNTEEDEAIRKENLAAREHYTKVGMQRLAKAIGNQAIRDYGKAEKMKREGSSIKMDGKLPKEVMAECKSWFNHPWFKATFGITDSKVAAEKAVEYQKIMDELKDLNEEERDKRINEILERRKRAV